MELSDLAKIARRRWAVIASIASLGVLFAALYAILTPKQYATTTQLFVSTSANSSVANSDAYQGSQYSEARVQSYADMVNNDSLAQKVISDLHLSMTPDQLSKMVSATAITNTVLLNVTVTNHDPKLALAINQALVHDLIDTINGLETPNGAAAPLLKVSVTNYARLPTSPVSPKPTFDIAFGLLIGLVVGLGAAVQRDRLDNTIKDLRSIRAFHDLPVLGGLVFDPNVQKTPLITSLEATAPRVEAYRVLRTNLQFLDVDQSSKVLVMTSSMPGEGKSTTVVNIAIALAQAGQRVLLMDADLRRPRIANLLGMLPNVGVSTFLAGKVTLDECMQTHAASGLTVLAAGAVPPNPADLLQSKAMDGLISQIRSMFDVVLIDSPPLLPVTDAALLASKGDGAVLVVRHGRTTKGQLAGSIDRLEAVGADVAGVIMNMVPKRGGLDAYGYGYGYGYGYASTDKTSPEAEPAPASAEPAPAPAEGRRASRAEIDRQVAAFPAVPADRTPGGNEVARDEPAKPADAPRIDPGNRRGQRRARSRPTR